ncbi:nitrogen fixation protein NifQ [Ramlibacter sp. H39-3-26]|uniref:nitrogen fixation protein NifQ n=1 Tax=Curvibacter soli TaxID=3031331 RepID=UPI0023DC684A|nr:nitrogen fixation protein NifQ [Ramlibacter sp. H39-3-26]MDF1484102.1 nitrogen fixation protein NifQ [Ramlibacter sp. H39-3-26]
MGTHALLMSHAADARDPAVLALAGVLSAAFERHGRGLLPMPGLDAAATRGLFARWFPGADAALGLDWPALAGADRHEPRRDEIEDLAALLRDHADGNAGPAQEARAVAYALACASLGDNHLWQDLFLPSRRELSALIGRWFPSLAARNSNDMKWKKFFYRQLCLREELLICKAPSCGVCTDYGLCFGTEEAAPAMVPV